MIPGRSVLLAAALAAAALAASAGAAPLPRDSDEFAYRIGGGTFLLADGVDSVVGEPDAAAQFERLGAERACEIYNRHRAAQVRANEPEFRGVLVGAIRSQVPPEILAGNEPLGWGMMPIEMRKRLIVAEVERTGGAVLDKGRRGLREAFLSEAAGASGAGADTGSFGDWDLASPLARKTACMLLRAGPASELGARKQPFDAFYRRKDAR